MEFKGAGEVLALSRSGGILPALSLSLSRVVLASMPLVRFLEIRRVSIIICVGEFFVS